VKKVHSVLLIRKRNQSGNLMIDEYQAKKGRFNSPGKRFVLEVSLQRGAVGKFAEESFSLENPVPMSSQKYGLSALFSLGEFRHGTLCTGYYTGSPNGSHRLLDLLEKGAPFSKAYDYTKTLIHPGIDLVAPAGTEMPAVLAGTVVDVVGSENDENFKSLGYMVMIRSADPKSSENLYAMYLHFQEPPLVAVGEQIKQGQAIGKVGNTGSAFGAHVHLEVRRFPERFYTPWGNIYGTVEPAELKNYSKEAFEQQWVDPLSYIYFIWG